MLLALLSCVVHAVRAHELPADVRVQAFVRPLGDRLQVLVRVPLAAMRESDLPLRGPGYLDLERAGPALRTAASLWVADNLGLRENGRPLGVPTIESIRVSLASDRSFEDIDRAIAHLGAPPLASSQDLVWNQQLLDVAFAYAIESPRSRFEIDARLARLGLRVSVALHFLPADGDERAWVLHGDEGWIALDPGIGQAASRFVAEGLRHILGGVDHLLFIVCLVLPLRRVAPLLAIVTAFAIAHSISLAAAVLGLLPDALWFAPLVEWLIAVSILLMALENMLGTSLSGRWIVGFVFGLVHGVGFATGLRESLQFAGKHLFVALTSFNVGIEIGQIVVLLVVVGALRWVVARAPERALLLILSGLIAHTAWHWCGERWAVLSQFPVPEPDAAALPQLLRWVAAALALGFGLYTADRALRRRLAGGAGSP
ncbi:MAG: HupE/UreJ family protein [Lautropia sp.]